MNDIIAPQKSMGMSSKPMASEDIVAYYDTCEIDYKLVWRLNDQLAMHYGYWDAQTKNLGQALENMNKAVLNRTDIQPGAHVLDAGCGVGGTSIFCASNYQAYVHGISLSQNQVEKAKTYAARAGAGPMTAFSCRDFTATGFADESFNAIYAMESVCHANEKGDFINEAFRLLKPGGTLVVGDFFRTTAHLEAKNQDLMAKWAKSWAVPHFEYHRDFEAKMMSAGFKTIQQENITDRIRPSADRLYWSFIPGLPIHWILRLVGLRGELHTENVWSTYYQYQTLKRDLWNYWIFKGKKQHG